MRLKQITFLLGGYFFSLPLQVTADERCMEMVLASGAILDTIQDIYPAARSGDADAICRYYSLYADYYESNRQIASECSSIEDPQGWADARDRMAALADESCSFREQEGAPASADEDGAATLDSDNSEISSCFRIELQDPTTVLPFSGIKMENVAIHAINECEAVVYADYVACSDDEIFNIGSVFFPTESGDRIVPPSTPYAFTVIGGFTVKQNSNYSFQYIASYDQSTGEASCAR